MKKYLTTVLQGKQIVSIPLLLASFGAGYLLAAYLFELYSLRLHRLLNYLIY